MPKTFSMTHRVRLSETDALGVVYYGQYFTYFDVSRLELLREIGINLSFLERRELGFMAAEALCRYRSSAKFDDVLTLNVGIEGIGRSSVVYAHRIARGRVTIAEGRVTDVMVRSDRRPVEIAPDIRSRLSKYARAPPPVHGRESVR